jgi:hypothetical protein
MLTLLIAAIGKQKRDLCKDYTIRIKGAQKNFFVDDKAILRLLEFAGNGKIKGQKKIFAHRDKNSLKRVK